MRNGRARILFGLLFPFPESAPRHASSQDSETRPFANRGSRAVVCSFLLGTALQTLSLSPGKELPLKFSRAGETALGSGTTFRRETLHRFPLDGHCRENRGISPGFSGERNAAGSRSRWSSARCAGHSTALPLVPAILSPFSSARIALPDSRALKRLDPLIRV